MLQINKKILILSISFLQVFSAVAKVPVVADYSTGVARIQNIMSNDETGVLAYNKKHVVSSETQNLLKDLNINEIADSFGCKTLIGKSYLVEMLKAPISPKDKEATVLKRQNAIKALVENSELKQEVDAILEQAKLHEQKIVELMSDYFKGESCPELKNLEIIKEQNPALYPAFKFFLFNPTGKYIGTGFRLFSLGSLITATGIYGKALYKSYSAGYGVNSKLAMYTAYLGLMSGVTGYQVVKDYSNAFKKRSKMHSLNQLILAAQNFEASYKKYGIEAQFKISDISDQNGISLVKSLQASRYKAETSYAFMTPAVHSFLYEIYDNEKHLAEVFACVAEMDVYNAIATKIIASQDKHNKFCLVNFIDSDKSEISSKGFWNVLVDESVVITNDLLETKHMIISGPNAGGKTTSIRSILQNILLGQSFGVAAAESFEFTPFDVIHSYINISDDLIGGLSLFASEVKRAQEVLERIKSLKPDTKYFFALDELFTGTAAENGEKIAYDFIDKISKMPGSLFMYATHFDKLKLLGDNNDYCQNYKVDAPTKKSDGALKYPFTLSQGASDVNIAMDIAINANLFG